jgi:hypothetical protein
MTTPLDKQTIEKPQEPCVSCTSSSVCQPAALQLFEKRAETGFPTPSNEQVFWRQSVLDCGCPSDAPLHPDVVDQLALAAAKDNGVW